MNNKASRVLLVEHREENAGRLLSGLERKSGAHTRKLDLFRVRNVHEARVQLLVGEYDAVLMGVEAPDLATNDLVTLGEQPTGTPILIYGAEAPDALRDEIIAAGADEYLTCGVLSQAELQLFARCLHNTIDRTGILAELENARRYSQHLAHHDDLTTGCPMRACLPVACVNTLRKRGAIRDSSRCSSSTWIGSKP